MSRNYKVTPWFNPSKDGRPVREGIYQRQYNDGEIVFCKYHNDRWYCGYSIHLSYAYNFANRCRMESFNQYRPWRGVIYV